MSTFYTTFLSKSEFSFTFALVTFEPLDIEQRFIPLLKALMCGINAVGAQRSGCMFTLCHAPLKMAVLLHLKHYFQRHVCLSIRPYVRTYVRPCVRRLAPIPAGESQDVTNKSCSICLMGDKKALRPARRA